MLKTYLYKILAYSLLFIMVVFILTGLLTVTSKIPKEMIEKNIELSVPYLSRLTSINYIKRYYPITWLDIYADEKILSIIYNIDSNNALQSIMEDRHYQTQNNRLNLKMQINDKSIEANTQYLRYWHGMMIFVRPLLIFLTIHGIYIFNAVIMGILTIILISILIRKKEKGLIIAFLLAVIMTGTVFTPFCLEYTWVFMIMLAVSIISILIEKKGNNTLFMLFFITGIITCFLDFLTNELVTILVPLLFVIYIRKREKEATVKEELIFLLKSLIIWSIGYCLMYIAKWVLASIILNINAFDYVKENVLLRLGATETDIIKLCKWVIPKNILILFPFTFLKNKLWILCVPLIAIPLFIIFRKKGKVKELLPIFIISILPYLRYLLLLNHSYFHSFFTFRAQFPTIMCIVLIFAFGTDKNKLIKKEP